MSLRTSGAASRGWYWFARSDLGDGKPIVLPFRLPGGDHRSLAAALNRALADMRAHQAYR